MRQSSVKRNEYGFSQDQWEREKSEILDILKDVAARQEKIFYIDLASQLTVIRLTPHEHAMGAILGQLSEEEDACGRGMISAVVVHKDGNMEPGLGFYHCATKLGRNVSDKTAFWISELNRVHEVWRDHN